jgi:hypothetical protein
MGRLMTTKGNVDVALQKSTDVAAKPRIETAMRYYVAAHEVWQRQNTEREVEEISWNAKYNRAPNGLRILMLHERIKSHPPISQVPVQWELAKKATDDAAQYTNASPAERKVMDSE